MLYDRTKIKQNRIKLEPIKIWPTATGVGDRLESQCRKRLRTKKHKQAAVGNRTSVTDTLPMRIIITSIATDLTTGFDGTVGLCY